jgi:dihydropteroate synthase
MKKIRIVDSLFDLYNKTLIMGILNVTPDSFYDGGLYSSLDDAINHAIEMEHDGADIIDIGGESTRPRSKYVSLSTEMSRVIPIIEELIKKIKIPISIDTYKSAVAEKALDLGVGMVNDITALRMDKNLGKIISKYEVSVCLMHMKGTPINMQKNPTYQDVMDEIKDFLKDRISYAISCGIRKENVIIDPGLGFGKRTGDGIEDNIEIINRLSELKEFDAPILIGASRKTFIGNVYGKEKQLPLNDRLQGSLEIAIEAVKNGANIVRVHDVKETRIAIDNINCNVR